MSLPTAREGPSLLRRLTLFDLTLISIGAIIGSGIFRNPSVVAARAHTTPLILSAWVTGGAVALIGAFIFAELGARRASDGGLYAYLRDAYHPIIAFMFGWTTLLIADSGGAAAAAVTFAGYVAPGANTKLVACTTIATVALINCFGVRQGGTWQNVLVALKIVAIAGVVVAGFAAHPHLITAQVPAIGGVAAITAFGVAMIPVLFAYNGFQAVSYISGETRDPGRTLPRGLLLGVSAVIVVYALVNVAYLRVLGPAGLGSTTVPASDVMQAWLGNFGARIVAVAVALSTLGFISTKLLLAPRVYFQMASDGTFFKALAWVHPKTRVPVVAILLPAVVASVIASAGSFDQILNWSLIEYLFTILAAGAIFVFRQRDRHAPQPEFRVPGHPWSTAAFMAVIAGVFVSLTTTYPHDMAVGAGIAGLGAVVYLVWRAFAAAPSAA